MYKPFSEKVEFGNVYLMRMVPEDDIIQNIQEFCEEKGLRRALIYSGVGSAKEVVVRDPKIGAKIPVEPHKTSEINLPGPYEILSLEGNVFPMEEKLVVHLHIMLGSEDGSVYGGHLMQAKIWTTLELMLTEIKNSRFYRRKSTITGLNEILVDQSLEA